jgi:hypothetical protein
MDAGVQGTMSSMVDEMVKTLASASENERREMVKARLMTFIDMGENERVQSMASMVAAVHKLDRDKVVKLTYTRLESMAEDFDEDSRNRLMNGHMMALMRLPKEIVRAEFDAIGSTIPQCHEGCRTKDVASMRRVMEQIPQDKRAALAQMLPESAKKMLMGG